MRYLRHSIRTLTFAVAVVALGTAALRSATELWASAMFTLTLAILATAILGALFHRGNRPFWTGFALFGWGYLVLAIGPWFTSEIQPQLVSSTVLNLLYVRLHSTSAEKAYVVKRQVASSPAPTTFPWASTGGSSVTYTTVRPPGRSVRTSFLRIGHSLFALLAALLGGVIARFFANRS